MASDDPDTSSTVVRTYVPAYQREEWTNHAEELGMSRSEFVRSMVQSGRKSFTRSSAKAEEVGRTKRDGSESHGSGSPSEGLEGRIETALDSDPYLSWDALVEELTEDIEMRVEEALDRLQRDGRVRYSGRRGGYTLVDDAQVEDDVDRA